MLPPVPKVHRITVVTGNDDPDAGDVFEVEFQTTAELKAYQKGLEDAEGWMEVIWTEEKI